MNKTLITLLCRVMIYGVKKAEYHKSSKCKCGNYKPYGLHITGCVAAMIPFYECLNCGK